MLWNGECIDLDDIKNIIEELPITCVVISNYKSHELMWDEDTQSLIVKHPSNQPIIMEYVLDNIGCFGLLEICDEINNVAIPKRLFDNASFVECYKIGSIPVQYLSKRCLKTPYQKKRDYNIGLVLGLDASIIEVHQPYILETHEFDTLRLMDCYIDIERLAEIKANKLFIEITDRNDYIPILINGLGYFLEHSDVKFLEIITPDYNWPEPPELTEAPNILVYRFTAGSEPMIWPELSDICLENLINYENVSEDISENECDDSLDCN